MRFYNKTSNMEILANRLGVSTSSLVELTKKLKINEQLESDKDVRKIEILTSSIIKNYGKVTLSTINSFFKYVSI